ncbi:hypothetical protein HDZ31DRAFT_84285 [Schizophyllum fasciatum]
MHVILTGPTGTIGLPVLHRCLETPGITRVSVLARRPMEIPSGYDGRKYDSSKAEVIVHEDFTKYDAPLLERLKGARAVIWAQGVPQSEVTKDEYIRITYDSPLAAAKAFATLPADSGSPFTFVHVSGEGADPDEKAWALFGNIKGRAEKDLLKFAAESPLLPPSLSTTAPQAHAFRAYNVRPAAVAPGKLYPYATRQRPLAYRVMGPVLVPALRVACPRMLSPTDEVATALVDLAVGNVPEAFHADGAGRLRGEGIEADGWTMRCGAIRAWAKLRGVVGM